MTANQAAPIPDASPGIHFMFDAAGRFAGWNRGHLETFGLSREAIVGHGVAARGQDAFGTPAREKLDHSLAGERARFRDCFDFWRRGGASWA